MVSNRSSPCHSLSHFLVEITSPLASKFSSYDRNSAKFVEKISNTAIHSNHRVILGVLSLFTKVPTDDVLAVVQDKLAEDPFLKECPNIPIDNLIEMLTFCVETTYFGIGSKIYRQEEGLAMGSLLSPALADIYMGYFEEMPLGSTTVTQSMWLRYLHDPFILWPHQEDV